jgi:hypothetical protein
MAKFLSDGGLAALMNNIKTLLAGKMDKVSAGTAGRLRTSSGTAGVVGELSATVGGVNQPVYINAGVPAAGNTMVATVGDQSGIAGRKTFSSSPQVTISGTARKIYAGFVSGSTLYSYDN